jgi:predicted O-linked N-acetylglucosamine transferase (SPINDLY family)
MYLAAMTPQELFDQAVAHHQVSRFDQAERLYRKILSTDPNHVDALHMLGVLIGQRGGFDEAVNLITRAISLRPDAYELYTNLAAFLAQMGRGEEAIAAYAQAAAVAPNSVEALYNHANALQSVPRYEESAEAFVKVLALKPDHGEALGGLGYTLLALGQLGESEAVYRELCRLRPTSPEATNNLANVLRTSGRVDESIGLFKRAIWLGPTLVSAHFNLGHALQTQGDLDSAILSYRTAVTYGRKFFEGWYHLGLALFRRGRFEESVRALHKGIELRPDYAKSHYFLGNALYKTGELQGAAEAYRKAIELRQDYSEAYNNLGNVLQSLGLVDEAIEQYRQLIRLRPELPEAQFNLGNALQSLGFYDEAISVYRCAVELRPTYAEALNNLGNSLRSRSLYADAAAASRREQNLPPGAPAGETQKRSDFEEAAAAFNRALALNPNFPEAHINLGNLYKDAGRLDEAIDAYRKAHELLPSPTTAGNSLYALYFHPGYGPHEIYEEHRKFNEEFIKPLAPFRLPHTNDPSPERRLRIGYVSPDFREHPVGRFMLPLLANHDHTHFEVFCYSDVRRDTPLTEQCRRHADVWRSTFAMSDEQLANQVREDRIDILVDLVMHMEGSRLLMFGRKPAPAQVTYLAYCGTTGCETIDYLLTDPYLAPAESERQFYFEKPVELRSYWCYTPPPDAPEVGPLPALSAGHVTFGCLNNFSKVSEPAIEAWEAILKSLPNSRLILHTHAGSHREMVLAKFAGLGVDPGRIELVGYLPMGEYLRTFNRVDVALDPFPYPGGTTSCDAAWMGVPIVTLAGSTAVSRGGASVLSHLGLRELIAKDASQYEQIAVDLAADFRRLAELRAGLRDRIQKSALMDAPGFARDVESAYRRMWHEWTQSPEAKQVSASSAGVGAEQLNAQGVALERQGRFAEAADCYRQALKLRPDWPDATFNLANALYGQNLMEESVETYRKVIALAPRFPEPFNNMGIALSALDRKDEALAAFQEAVRLNPGYADGYASLGTALRDVGRLEEAAAASRRALELKPESTIALTNLGNIAIASRSVDEAIGYFGRARAFDPTPSSWHNYLFALNFSPKLTARQIADEHAVWEQQYILPRVQPFISHANSRDPERPLRIGYVSPDFREHGVGRFLLPLFSRHDRRQFQIYCYSAGGAPDALTDKLRSFAHAWRDVSKIDDAQLAKLVHDDQIDILIDLSMHSGGSRLPAFAYTPAPVQMTYLGYAGTTGLHAIDYRLTDVYLDPPNLPGAPFVEKPIRLRTHWCYQPPESVPPISSPPALASGFVTFGCLNNFGKVNSQVLAIWREILQSVPNSHLKLHAYDGPHRQRTKDFFADAGIAPERISFTGFLPADQYFQQYHSIDIALDPFPFAGATTTCDALYMGIPPITMPGTAPLSRAGASILSNAGHSQFIAGNPQDYVQRAIALARDVGSLNDLRQSMRGRMHSSVLMDAVAFARDVENAYRQSWRHYCEPL